MAKTKGKGKGKGKARASIQDKAKGPQAKALADLAPLAKEINHRLKEAEAIEGKALDHRLAACLQLDTAKKRCAKGKVNFKKWCDENIAQSYETVRKLAACGGAKKPALALEDLRARTARAMRVSRAKGKADGVTSRGSQGRVTSAAAPKEPVAALLAQMRGDTETERTRKAGIVADSAKMGLVTLEQVKALRVQREDAVAGVYDLFVLLGEADRRRALDRLAGVTDGALLSWRESETAPEAGDAGTGDIPGFLKRAGKTKAGAKVAAKARKGKGKRKR